MNMILTMQQKFLLHVLREFKCLRQNQLQTLLSRQFHAPGRADVNERHVTTMLHQLRHGNWDIQTEGGYVYLDNALPDSRILEAVDIMLELTETAPMDFKKKTDLPPLLRFIVAGERLRFCTVAYLYQAEDIALLEQDRVGRIVWITDNGRVPDGLTLPPKHFFAARQKDGSHRFYGSTTEL